MQKGRKKERKKERKKGRKKRDRCTKIYIKKRFVQTKKGETCTNKER
jgi:hypothetical protein